MGINDKAWDIGFRRELGDESNPTWAIVIGGTSNALHLVDPLNAGTDYNLSASTTPTLYIHGSATAPTEYVQVYTDETDGYFKVTGGNARIESAGNIHLEPVATSGYVKIGGTQSWVATATAVVALATGAAGLGTAVAEWLCVYNEDGSERYIPSWKK